MRLDYFELGDTKLLRTAKHTEREVIYVLHIDLYFFDNFMGFYDYLPRRLRVKSLLALAVT